MFTPSLERWHSRLDHPSYTVVEKVIKSHKLTCLDASNKSYVCDACQRAKSHQLTFPRSSSESKYPLELIYSDVWGDAPQSVGGFKYYVSFIDDYSKFTWIYLLKYKSDVFQKFHDFQQLVERLFNRKIIAMQTDWGGEYQKLHTFFQKAGITHHISCPHTHQQNGSAERKHRHIVEVGLSLLAHSSMPLKFWDEAFLSAIYLINSIPSRVLKDISPLEKLFAKQPDYNALRMFSCSCWPNLRPYNKHKLQFRYSIFHKGFKCLDLSTGRVYISRDVIFDETKFPFAKLLPNAGARVRAEITLLLDASSLAPIGQQQNCHVNNSPENPDETHAVLQQVTDATAPCNDAGPESASSSAAATHQSSGSTQLPTSPSAPSAPASPRAHSPCGGGTSSSTSAHTEVAASTASSSSPAAAPVSGSSAAGGNSSTQEQTTENPSTSVTAAEINDGSDPYRPRTRLQSGIRKEKVYTDDTVKWGFFIYTSEPQNLQESLNNNN